MVGNKIIRKSITSITTIISIIGIGIIFGSNCYIFSSGYKIDDIKIKDECEYILITNCDDEYCQMYNIIEKASGLDKDPYGRKISPHVVKKFCHIARNRAIDLNNMTEKQFDTIYRTYTEYLIEKYKKRN
jgi:hypothetical protein